MPKMNRCNRKHNLLTRDLPLKSLFCLFNKNKANFDVDCLLERKSELEIFTKSNLNSEDLINFLRVLLNVYKLRNCNKRSQILALTLSEEFLNNIKTFLQCNRNVRNFKQAVDLIMFFVDVNINEIPSSNIYYDRLYSLLKVLHDVQVGGNLNYPYWAYELCLLLQKKIIHRETRKSWKDSHIYPSAVDFFEKKDLMASKINGAYTNTEEYLDTMFKLMKEDFEGNLREEVSQVKAQLRGSKTEEKHILVYNNVSAERLETDGNPIHGIVHRIAFPTGHNIRRFPKRFKYGSLLLLTQYSQFTNFILASVIEDVELQRRENDSCKVLKVYFVGDRLDIQPYWRYTMLESRRIFKPYYDVLKAIQSKNSENFPMEKYLVYTNTTPCFPKYITTDSEYIIEGKLIKLFGNIPWPNNLLNLDPSQVEALQTALTHEFVLIQGPPGSGKSHLVQTIIEILIGNKSFLSTPILLISSDNHSVDKILESLVLKEKNVIKLGNLTKSEVLKDRLINNRKKQCGKDVRTKIERIKESIVRKMYQNEENVETLVESMKREQALYIEITDKTLANQILSEEVDVIGGTSVGCAKLHGLLQEIKPEVVIIENANEVLEAHVIATLSEGCKHLILVGDVKQLKPCIYYKNLENYDFDVSLFERMMRCGVKCCTLKEQHRMRPEIASLLSPTVYQTLENHPVVHNLPKIRGMKQNLFFINHEVAENRKRDDENSCSNRHEGDILLGLASYLVSQGYSTEDITILVPYIEQLRYMEETKRYPLLKNLEIFTIDTYAGHENTIILLSLVRSQSAGIGFLTNNNKVVVALSRAKAGLYMIGNMKTLMAHSDLWVSLNADLKKKQAIGKSIQLECETHKRLTNVSKKEDFEQLSEGGCDLQCNLLLGCGHFCHLKCHPSLEQHATIICSEPCTRLCMKNLHKCKKQCNEECEQCDEDISIVLPCGHSIKKKCSDDNYQIEICQQPTVVSYMCCLQKVLPCWQSNSWFYRRVEGLV